ncbi:hypothetical protein B9479_004302 [Cryptococcus floricola]|uniref:Uncharacterized protein n=1 Tax=Cryptococcus floricola TaxID=2591691 RepID=A0A5D3AXQ7_9TREE|nr:hypothetical protein B9479_004302 [Cryptococcus floricola]
MLPRTTQDIIHDKETTPLIEQGTSGSSGQNARTLDAQDIPPRGTGHNKIDIWLREQRKLNTGWARGILPPGLFFAMAVIYGLMVLKFFGKRKAFMETCLFWIACAVMCGVAAGVKFKLDRHVRKVAESMKVALMDGDEGRAAQLMYNRAVPVVFVDKKNKQHKFRCFPPSAQFYPVPLSPTSYPLFRKTSVCADVTPTISSFLFAPLLVDTFIPNANAGRDAPLWETAVLGIVLAVGLFHLLWFFDGKWGYENCSQGRRNATISQRQEWKDFMWMQEQMGWWGVLAMEQSLGNGRMGALKTAMRGEEKRYVDERNKLLQKRIAQGHSSQDEYEALAESINVELLNGAV